MAVEGPDGRPDSAAGEPADVKKALMRKVAQLTKVVVHLNARNDEAELRYERLRAGFEDEIRTITQDAVLKVRAQREQLGQLVNEAKLAEDAERLAAPWTGRREEARAVLEALKEREAERKDQFIEHGCSRLGAATAELRSLAESMRKSLEAFREVAGRSREELEQRDADLREQRQKELRQVAAEHQRRLDDLRAAQTREVEHLRAAHEQAVTHMQRMHESELSTLRMQALQKRREKAHRLEQNFGEARRTFEQLTSHSGFELEQLQRDAADTEASCAGMQQQVDAMRGTLEEMRRRVEQAEALPWMYSFLTDYLPVMALIGLQCLLPCLFEFMAVRYEGHKTKSEVQRIVLNRCFGYQLASLCVTMITGSIWIELQDILRTPASLLGLLSSSLPKVAVYFVTFVLTRTGFSLPLLLLRPWDLLQGPPASAVRCAFGSEAANAALVLVIGLTYSFIAPAILPVCALYFGFAAVVYRWLFGYVYEPEFDGRGAFWYDLFNSALLGLLVGTLALVALACVRATALQVAFVAPLPLGVAWFGYWCWGRLGKPSQLVALADAVAADGQDGLPEASSELYCGPKEECSEAAVSE